MTNQARLKDIEATFDAMPKKASKDNTVYLNGASRYLSLGHIQGLATYNNKTLISANVDNGKIFIFSDNQYEKALNTPEGYTHPSGMQVVEEYLVLGIQSDDYIKNKVYCFPCDAGNFSLSGFELSIPNLRSPENPNGQSCPSVGITTFEDKDGKQRYILIISGDGKSTIYESNLTNKGLSSELKFTQKIQTTDISVQGIQLLTQQDGQIYIIPFDSKPIKTLGVTTSYKDYINLYRYDYNINSITALKKEHISTYHPDSLGLFGVHCRWGAGVKVKNQTLTCIISERDMASEITTNYFTGS